MRSIIIFKKIDLNLELSRKFEVNKTESTLNFQIFSSPQAREEINFLIGDRPGIK